MDWNFNMEEAPRGKTMQVDRKNKHGNYTADRHMPDFILAAGADGETVTRSRWLPDQGRWNMFSKDNPPIAWMPWPVHPGVSK